MKNKNTQEILLTVVVPTRNEKENVTLLVEEIERVLRGQSYAYELIFVDDSDDETPSIISSLVNNNSHVHLIHRTGSDQTGLATAVVEGIKKAKGDYICCLDADLQHPPSLIPKLLDVAFSEDFDITVASRYMNGGSAYGLSGRYRRFVSTSLRYVVHFLLPQSRVTTDPGSGFFLIQKKILNGINLKPRGFKILLEILVRAKYKAVTQVPYAFLSRKDGESKAYVKQGADFIRHILQLLLTAPHTARFLRFCLVGASGVVVNIGTLILLIEIFSFNVQVAWILSVLLSIGSNYVLNSKFTFSDIVTRGKTFSKGKPALYYMTSFIAFILQYSLFNLCVSLGFHYVTASLIAIIVATMLSFTLATKIVWKKSDAFVIRTERHSPLAT